MSDPDPVCINILFCDNVIVENGTGKTSFIGSTRGLAHYQFPLVLPRFCIAATIGNLGERDPINVTFNIGMSDSGVIIASGNMQLKRHAQHKQAQLPYGLDFFDIHIPFDNLSIPMPQKYQVTVLIDGEEVGKRFLPVIAVPRPQNPQIPTP